MVKYFCLAVFLFRRCFVLECVIASFVGSSTFWLKHLSAQARLRLQLCTLLCVWLVAVGWAVATLVSEPPRGCRWETDIHGNIGLRMLTLFTHDQSAVLIGYVYSICVRASPYVV